MAKECQHQDCVKFLPLKRPEHAFIDLAAGLSGVHGYAADRLVVGQL